MEILYSTPEKRLLGIGTKDGKPQRVRTINNGELLRLAYYPCPVDNAEFLKTKDNIMILGRLSIGAIIFKISYATMSNALGSTAKFAFYIFGKNEDSFDEIKSIGEIKTTSVSAGVFSEIIFDNISGKTIYESCKDDGNINFVNHKKDHEWYLGLKITTPYTDISTAITGFKVFVTYCEGTPSEMPLEEPTS